MMAGILGEETLNFGLAMYLYRHQYETVTEDHLFSSLEEAGLVQGSWPYISNITSFGEVMKPWTQQAGYPLVTVERLPSSLVITQSWYRLDHPDSTDQLWDIPISGMFVGPETKMSDWEDTAPLAWMTSERIEMEISPEDSGPVIINKLATGYY